MLATAVVWAASQIAEGFSQGTPSKLKKAPTLQARASKIAQFVLLMGSAMKANPQAELVLVFGAQPTRWLALANPVLQSIQRAERTATRLESFGRILAMMKGPGAVPRTTLSARLPLLACKVAFDTWY